MWWKHSWVLDQIQDQFSRGCLYLSSYLWLFLTDPVLLHELELKTSQDQTPHQNGKSTWSSQLLHELTRVAPVSQYSRRVQENTTQEFTLSWVLVDQVLVGQSQAHYSSEIANESMWTRSQLRLFYQVDPCDQTQYSLEECQSGSFQVNRMSVEVLFPLYWGITNEWAQSRLSDDLQSIAHPPHLSLPSPLWLIHRGFPWKCIEYSKPPLLENWWHSPHW